MSLLYLVRHNVAKASLPRCPGAERFCNVARIGRGRERSRGDGKLGPKQGKLPSLHRVGRHVDWQGSFLGEG